MIELPHVALETGVRGFTRRVFARDTMRKRAPAFRNVGAALRRDLLFARGDRERSREEQKGKHEKRAAHYLSFVNPSFTVPAGLGADVAALGGGCTVTVRLFLFSRGGRLVVADALGAGSSYVSRSSIA